MGTHDSHKGLHARVCCSAKLMHSEYNYMGVTINVTWRTVAAAAIAMAAIAATIFI